MQYNLSFDVNENVQKFDSPQIVDPFHNNPSSNNPMVVEKMAKPNTD